MCILHKLRAVLLRRVLTPKWSVDMSSEKQPHPKTKGRNTLIVHARRNTWSHSLKIAQSSKPTERRHEPLLLASHLPSLCVGLMLRAHSDLTHTWLRKFGDAKFGELLMCSCPVNLGDANGKHLCRLNLKIQLA